MSSFIKKLFGALVEKPWEENQAKIDNHHQGRTFTAMSSQVSAVIIIFGVSTVLFSLIVTAYLYSIPSDQDTMFLFRPNLFWFNTLVLISVAYIFRKITKDLENNRFSKIRRNLVQVGGLSYLFLFGQIFLWFQLMESGKFVSTNSYFTSFYLFTALHGLHLLGGLLFWGKVCSKILKLKEEKIIDEKNSVEALSLYWTFLLIIWLVFFLIVYIFNDAVIAWCKALIS
jgi:cytochrome c oxidase subunit 3|tara:strand:+ start:84 stop:767 length:684 start_codon:yes stop_codon:yes gene_type:complete